MAIIRSLPSMSCLEAGHYNVFAAQPETARRGGKIDQEEAQGDGFIKWFAGGLAECLGYPKTDLANWSATEHGIVAQKLFWSFTELLSPQGVLGMDMGLLMRRACPVNGGGDSDDKRIKYVNCRPLVGCN